MQKIVLVAYIPVLHAGYLDFLQKHLEADFLVLLDRETIASLGESFDYIVRKDMIRSLRTAACAAAIRSLWPLHEVVIGDGDWKKDADVIIMPDEDVSREFARRYLDGHEVHFEPMFLRYDRSRAQAREDALSLATCTLDPASFESSMLAKAFDEARQSWDWWRQVGAVLALDGKALLWSRNQHMPQEQWPYAFGDPRSLFKGGEMIDVSTAQHAESRLIGEAARRGINTSGADLFITTFPCVPCMEHVGSAGIKRIFFVEGSYGLNSREVLDLYGIEAIHVKV